MNVALILAGGIGSRMGADRPKQFIEVQGKPVIVHTIERFQNHPEIDYIEVVCVEPYIQELKTLVDKFNLTKVKKIVPGGDTYQGSVINGMNGLSDVCSDDDIIVTHMSANPIVFEDLITDSIRVCKEHKSTISLYTQVLCLGNICNSPEGAYTDVSINRDHVVGLNTPQSVQYGLMKELYKRAAEKGILDKMDPHLTELMYQMGQPMYFTKGSPLNIKITTPDDLVFFEAYLIAQQLKNNKK